MLGFCRKFDNKDLKYGKNAIATLQSSSITQIPSSSAATQTLDSAEPPTKLIKLINGSAILAPMDNKMMHSVQLTLSQVVGGGGLVVSPIQLLSSQGLRVIGQSNGLTTIELSAAQSNYHPDNFGFLLA